MKLSIPPAKQSLLDTIAARLSAIPGVEAVALGGSYARGRQHPGSDLDIGIYYREDAPFRIEDIRAAAAALSVQGEPTVTGLYGWGAWVNGGAWIHSASGKVDFLYRNLDQVERAIAEAQQGVTQHDFDQQPAYGFYSVIYLAETNVCLPLYDPHGAITRLKQLVACYPAKLKESLVSSALWMAEFSLLHGAGFAEKGDIYSTSGSLTRAASFMTQALFALNETYFMTDKTAMQEIAGFDLRPEGYGRRLGAVLGQMGELKASVEALRGLWQEVVDLTRGGYKPAFRM